MTRSKERDGSLWVMAVRSLWRSWGQPPGTQVSFTGAESTSFGFVDMLLV